MVVLSFPRAVPLICSAALPENGLRMTGLVCARLDVTPQNSDVSALVAQNGQIIPPRHLLHVSFSSHSQHSLNRHLFLFACPTLFAFSPTS